jgi:hypothetical protein
VRPVSPVLDMALTGTYIAVSLFIIGVFAMREPQWLAVLLAFIGAVAVFIPACKRLFTVIGSSISNGPLSAAPFNRPLRHAATLRKFADTGWQLVIHVSMSLLELYVAHNETWWNETNTCWTDIHTFVPKSSLAALYLIQLAIWITMGFYHRFVEERKKDYAVMFIHHIATIILVGGSFITGYQRIGVLVLLVHDISDIPIDVMKMANYLKVEGPAGFFMSEIAYVTNMAVWIGLRLYLFPWKVMYSARVESITVANVPTLDWALFNGMLTLLLILHLWWTALMLRIGYKVVTRGAHAAGEDEYEGVSDDEKDD